MQPMRRAARTSLTNAARHPVTLRQSHHWPVQSSGLASDSRCRASPAWLRPILGALGAASDVA